MDKTTYWQNDSCWLLSDVGNMRKNHHWTQIIAFLVSHKWMTEGAETEERGLFRTMNENNKNKVKFRLWGSSFNGPEGLGCREAVHCT